MARGLLIVSATPYEAWVRGDLVIPEGRAITPEWLGYRRLYVTGTLSLGCARSGFGKWQRLNAVLAAVPAARGNKVFHETGRIPFDDDL